LTQIQEITLTFIPKIVAIFLAVALFAPLIGGEVSTFTNVLYKRIESGF
jgi:flagellar biosynthetic protein FliQ